MKKRGKKTKPAKDSRQFTAQSIGGQKPAFRPPERRAVTGSPLALVRLNHELARGEQKKF
jgi:hypothetical protein